MQALLSGDAERFYREEIRMREAAGLPPFGRLAALIVSADDREAAEAHARAPGPRRAEATRTSWCSARPRRRSRWSAAATASACW